MATTTTHIVQTKYGALRGFSDGRVYSFLGVKYADAKRFHLPQPPEAWDGVRDAFTYGWASPTLRGNRPQDETLMPLRFWPEDENCQYLNIWSKSLDPAAKKPVMFWIHGGGYAAGSAIEHTYYLGENLSADGDVVVVTVNHRLNIFGYLDLSPFGAEYEGSADAGNADLVAALQWVHDNIAQFGGDPENVTIFGQSGGGAKIQNIMQMPSADGLYHRAVIQSGVIRGLGDNKVSADGRQIVEAMLADLSLSSAKELENIPAALLIASYNKVSPQVAAEGGYIGGSPMAAEFTEYSKTVPTMVGTTFAEFTYTAARSDKYELDEAAKREVLAARFGEKTDEVIDLFRRTYPDKDICDAIIADTMCRSAAIDFVREKAASSTAPVYMYLYTYECVTDHTTAWHCGEIPFVFRNSKMVARCVEEGVSDRLEAQMSDAWVAFARTGAPGHADIPEWVPCTADSVTTMIFDRTCAAKTDFDREYMDYMTANFPMTMRLAPPPKKAE